MIKIGDASLKTRAAKDEAAFVDATGCNRRELETILRAHPDAHLVASALSPMLVDEQPLHELTAAIAAVGAREVGVEVADLLAKATDEAEPAKQ